MSPDPALTTLALLWCPHALLLPRAPKFLNFRAKLQAEYSKNRAVCVLAMASSNQLKLYSMV